MKYFFSTGTARGGTNLITKSLSVSPEIKLANDPYLALCKYLRSVLLRKDIGLDIDPSEPLYDYYFEEKWRAVIEALLNPKRDNYEFDPVMIPPMIKAIEKRAAVSSPKIVPFLKKIDGETFRELIDLAISVLVEAYSEGVEPSVAGFNENWAIEIFPLLAKIYPEAKFMIIVRDPRASICSAMKQKDPSKQIKVFSFARGWRKNIAFMKRYLREDIFKDRLIIVKYEDFVLSPEEHLRRISGFLGVKFIPEMLDPRYYKDGSGKLWQGNSYIHDERPQGIYTGSVNAWEEKMPKDAAEVVEFINSFEMEELGYRIKYYDGNNLSAGALEFIFKDDKVKSSWESSKTPVEDEIGRELFRQQLIRSGFSADKDILKRAFLFEPRR